jgi:hypothetical protein
VVELRGEADRVHEATGTAGNGTERVEPASPRSMDAWRASLTQLRQLGTILSLEMERDRVGGSPGAIFERFTMQMDEVERSAQEMLSELQGAQTESSANGSGALEVPRGTWRQLVEKLGSLERRLEEVRDR